MPKLTDAEVKALLDRTVMRDYPSLGPWHTAGPALAQEVLDARAIIARLESAIREAPHAESCELDGRSVHNADAMGFTVGPCDCWKAAALAEPKGER